jgi:hypothetical protein
VRDGRKYTIGEVTTFHSARNSVSGRVVEIRPNPKAPPTVPNAAYMYARARLSVTPPHVD